MKSVVTASINVMVSDREHPQPTPTSYFLWYVNCYDSIANIHTFFDVAK